MNKDQATAKVQLLLRLAASAPENEAKAADAMAKKLIEKYALTEEEYVEKEVKPLYTDDAILFEELLPTEWRPRLAFACADKYDCYVIKEENRALLTGTTVYKYFVYGYDTDVATTKALFHLLNAQIEELVKTNCEDQDALFTSSYADGVVSGVKINIEYEDFDLKAIVKTQEEKPILETNSDTSIEKVKEPKKEKPIEETTQLNVEEKPINIIAYWKGERDGSSKIHIGKKNSAFTVDQEWANVLDLDVDEDISQWSSQLGFKKEDKEEGLEADDFKSVIDVLKGMAARFKGKDNEE